MDAQCIFTVADEILSSSPEAAVASFATVLTDVFDNDSFTENVIDGGDTRLFEENLSKVSLSVSKIEEVALNSATLDAAEKSEVQEKLARVQELLSLLGSTVEGA